MTHGPPPRNFADPGAVIPRGVAHVQFAAPKRTREFAFLTLPRFTLLAFSSAVDPLRIANQLTQQPLYNWSVVSVDGGPTESSAGIRIEANHGLRRLGRDTTIIVCSGIDAAFAADTKVLNWLRDHSRHGGSIGAVCTGAYTLARAGLLGGDATTVHWENQAAFRELFDIEPLQQIYFIGQRHFSCAGGEAAVDMMLALIAEDHGQKLADAVAEMCLHARRREAVTTQKRAFTAPLTFRNPGISRVIAAMQSNIASPLSEDDLACIFGKTPRQLQRSFKAATGETPMSFYLGLRLEQARDLLAETTMSTLEVAFAAGFNSRGSFARSFRRRFGLCPSRFR
jgi:transcriptional regulator GlxA family with amidase domain